MRTESVEPAPMPRRYVPRYSAIVIGNALDESRITFSDTGEPSGFENWPRHRARFASTFPPCACPKKNTTTSVLFAESAESTTNCARRDDDDGLVVVQPAGTATR